MEDATTIEVTGQELAYLARCVDLGRSDSKAARILQPTERDALLRKLGGRRD